VNYDDLAHPFFSWSLAETIMPCTCRSARAKSKKMFSAANLAVNLQRFTNEPTPKQATGYHVGSALLRRSSGMLLNGLHPTLQAAENSKSKKGEQKRSTIILRFKRFFQFQ